MSNTLEEEIQLALSMVGKAYGGALESVFYRAKPGMAGKRLSRLAVLRYSQYFLDEAEMAIEAHRAGSAYYLLGLGRGLMLGLDLMPMKPPVPADETPPAPAPRILEAPAREAEIVSIISRQQPPRKGPVDPTQGCHVIPFPQSA